MFFRYVRTRSMPSKLPFPSRPQTRRYLRSAIPPETSAQHWSSMDRCSMARGIRLRFKGRVPLALGFELGISRFVGVHLIFSIDEWAEQRLYRSTERAPAPVRRTEAPTSRSAATTPTSSSSMCALTTRAPGPACTSSRGLSSARALLSGTMTLGLAGRIPSSSGRTASRFHAEIRRLRIIRSSGLQMEALFYSERLGPSWRITPSRP